MGRWFDSSLVSSLRDRYGYGARLRPVSEQAPDRAAHAPPSSVVERLRHGPIGVGVSAGSNPVEGPEHLREGRTGSAVH